MLLKVPKVYLVVALLLWSSLFPLIFGTEDGATKSFIFLNTGLIIGALISLFVGRFSFHQIPLKSALLIVLTSFVMILTPTAFLSQRIIINDLFELHRPVLYFLAFALPCGMRWNRSSLRVLKFGLLIILLVNLVFVNIQFFSPPDDLTFMTNYYQKPGNLLRMHRTGGTFDNPYDLCFILILPTIFYFCRLCIGKGSLISFIILAAITFAILTTQSRTGLVLYGASFVVTAIWAGFLGLKASRFRSISSKILLVFLVVGSGLILGMVCFYDDLHNNFSYSFSGIENLLLRGELDTLGARIEQFKYFLEGADRNLLTIIFGNGVSKGVARYLESYIVLYLFRYGLFGLFFVSLVVLFLPIFYSVKAFLKNYKSRGDFLDLLLLSLVIWYIVNLIACAVNPFMDIPRIQFFYYFFFGLVYSLSKVSYIDSRSCT
jgi:hypothetical protein